MAAVTHTSYIRRTGLAVAIGLGATNLLEAE
jgi:hypothetical protein